MNTTRFTIPTAANRLADDLFATVLTAIDRAFGYNAHLTVMAETKLTVDHPIDPWASVRGTDAMPREALYACACDACRASAKTRTLAKFKAFRAARAA